MTALLVVAGLTALGWTVGLLVPRPRARPGPDEPLSVVADRVLAQVRALPEAPEPRAPGQR
ncbi:MAG TPA: hypothetical protein VLB47_10915 [Solirubrobacteraceae bacterium]|nr:hypothetical protein [Solirubrobacteraceae bacterium]